MVRTMLGTAPIRFLADAMLGLAVFVVTTALLVGPPVFEGLLGMGANAASLTHQAVSPLPAAGLETSLTVLAVSFALMFALNAAFLRHLTATMKEARNESRATPSQPRGGEA